jgi:DNA-binding MarR family transcriptional regulator
MDRGLLALRRVVRIIRTDLSHELPVQQLALLLEVAGNEGIGMPDLSRALKMGQGSVSKNVKLMSKYIEDGQMRGFGLLATEQDLQERRRFVVYTTPKGKEFMNKLAEALEPALERPGEADEEARQEVLN